MTDEVLRALERDARGRPDDANAAHAFGVALLRGGSRREAALELGRAMRLGHEGARSELERWVTWPGPLVSRAGSASPLSGGATREERTTIDCTFEEVVGVAAGTISFAGSVAMKWPEVDDPDDPDAFEGLDVDFDQPAHALVALRARPLETRWTRPYDGKGMTCLALVGDDVFRAEDAAIEQHDAATGEIIRKIELPERANGLRVWGDRAVASLFPFGDGPTLVGVDLSSGRVDWTRRMQAGSGMPGMVSRAGGRAAWTTYDGGAIPLLDVATGEDAGLIAKPSDGEIAGLVASDARGALVRVEVGRQRFVEEHDLGTGARRWRTPAGAAIVSEDIAVLVGEGRIAAVDRTKRATVWKGRLPVERFTGALTTEGEGDDLSPEHRFAIAGPVLYVGCAGAHGVTLVALELRTGRKVLEHVVAVDVDGSRVIPGPGSRVRGFDIVPVERGVVVLVASEQKTAAILIRDA